MNFERIVDLPAGVGEHYFWRSEGEVCFFRHLPHEDDPLQPGNFELIYVNTETGEAADLREFNVRNSSGLVGSIARASHQGVPGDDVINYPPQHAVSPDGRWLTWLRRYPPETAEWITAALDGSTAEHRRYPMTPRITGGHPLWFSDSRRWAALVQKYENQVHSIEEAGVFTLNDLETEQHVTITEGSDGLLVGMDYGGDALFRLPEWKVRVAERALMLRIPLRPGTVTPTRFEIQLPSAAFIWDIVSSPDGTQLAWVLGGANPRSDPHEIWLSGIAGEDMRPLASVPLFIENSDQRVTGKRCHFPRKLAWRPGGEVVSFIYRNALWSVRTSATD